MINNHFHDFGDKANYSGNVLLIQCEGLFILVINVFNPLSAKRILRCFCFLR